MNKTSVTFGIALMGWTSLAGAAQLTWTTESGESMTSWVDGDCSTFTENASRERTLARTPTCTPTRRDGHVQLAQVGETQFVADSQTGAIHAIVGRENPEMREVFLPFKSRQSSGRRRMVTATVADDAVTFHVTTFAPGGGRDASETTAVTYNASTLAVVAQAAVAPVRVQTSVLNYWGSE